MSRLNWSFNRDYEVGVDRGVFYPKEGMAEPWNGLVSVAEQTVDISQRVRYFEGRKIANNRRDDSFSATVQAFSVPQSFLPRVPFNMSYRVATARGYKIHLVYNALGYIPARSYNQSEMPEPISMEIATVPTSIPELASSAHLIVDTSVAYPGVVTQFEDLIYGNAGYDARLPDPIEIFDLFETNAIYKVIDNGDGTFTLEASDEVFEWLSATVVEADWPRVVYLDEDTYRIRSW